MKVDCKQISTEQTSSPQPSGSLYPELELKKMSLSMISSTSTALDGYMSTSSNEGAVALEPAVPIERQRAPYSVSSDGQLKKLFCCSSRLIFTTLGVK